MATSMRHVRRLERLKKFKETKKQSDKCVSFMDKQKWKPFQIDPSAFADDEVGGFIGMEVLTDYDPTLLRMSMSGTKRGIDQRSKSRDEDRNKESTQQKLEKATSSAANKGGRKSVKKKDKRNEAKGPYRDDLGKRTIKTVDSASVVSDERSANTRKGRTKRKNLLEKTCEGKDDTNIDCTTVTSDESQKQRWDAGKSRKRKSGKERLLEIRMSKKRRTELVDDQEVEEEEGKTTVQEAPHEEKTEKRDAASSEVEMSTWDTLSIPCAVLRSLQAMGFSKPTPIQNACIPPAIDLGKDMVGAAETGSGKTLAFGIPLIYGVLQQRAIASFGKLLIDDSKIVGSEIDGDIKLEIAEINNEMSKSEEGGNTNDIDEDDDNMVGKNDDDDYSKSKIGCVRVIDNIDDEAWHKAGLPLAVVRASGSGQGELFGLVLTPTRELAIQVKNHLVAAAKMTDVKVAVVVGGMSAEKQKRVLKKKPDIIVGTPGRLWELYKLGEPHLSGLPDIHCLVIDEADRMVEKGHYAELSEILDLLNGSEMKSTRQTFVFSATLSLVHLGPLRKSLKKQFKLEKKDKLESIMFKVGIKENAEIIDLTKREGTASSLLESKIVCEVNEKDIYLFYFLLQYPGRTLVFTNSIDCIRRLVSIFSLLECSPLPLHSSMHQKQRLKNLERFTSNPRGVLLATDVAARGLDIPDIQYVIHYQVPRTSESYVHRSGRTARQAKVGLSVTFVSPNEINFYRRLCKTLNREELPTFPVEHSYYQAVKQRVDLARDVDKMDHDVSKKKHQNDWFLKAAKDLDVDLDEDMILHDLGDSMQQKQYNKKLKLMKGHLKKVLKRRIFPMGSSQLYPTSSGKLLSPFAQASIGTSDAASKLKARMKADKEEETEKKEKRRRKFKRMGRHQKAS